MNKLKRGKHSQIINIVQKRKKKKRKKKHQGEENKRKKNWQLRRKELKLSDFVFLFLTFSF